MTAPVVGHCSDKWIGPARRGMSVASVCDHVQGQSGPTLQDGVRLNGGNVSMSLADSSVTGFSGGLSPRCGESRGRDRELEVS